MLFLSCWACAPLCLLPYARGCRNDPCPQCSLGAVQRVLPAAVMARPQAVVRPTPASLRAVGRDEEAQC